MTSDVGRIFVRRHKVKIMTAAEVWNQNAQKIHLLIVGNENGKKEGRGVGRSN